MMINQFDLVGTMDNWKKGDLPNNQFLNIVLAEYSDLENGDISICPQLANDSEIDFYIDKLIKDLEKLRKRAKRKIKVDNEKIRKAISTN